MQYNEEEELGPRPRRKSFPVTKAQTPENMSIQEGNNNDSGRDQNNLKQASENRSSSSSTSSSTSIGDQVQVSENTAKMLKFYKNKQAKLIGKTELLFSACLTNVPRKVTAKAFFHTMELASVGMTLSSSFTRI